MTNFFPTTATLRRGLGRYLTLGVLLAAAPFATLAQTGNVGIGTTSPSQTLDVNGQLRVRGLSGTDTRLPTVGPDGTLGVSAPVFSSAANTATPIPTAPTGTVGTDRRPRSVAVSGTTAYVVSEGAVINSNNLQNNPTLQVFDVSNPARPVLLGQAPAASIGYTCASVAVSGTTACLACKSNISYNGVLKFFDVSNPASPVVNGDGQGPLSVAANSSRVCAVEYFNGGYLYAYAVNPAGGAPTSLGNTFLEAPGGGGQVVRGTPTSVAVSGTTAFVTLDSGVLQVVDVTGQPVLMGRVPTAGAAYGMAVSGTTLYVAADGGLQTFNIANPNNPLLLSTVATGASQRVAVSGTRAYLAQGATLQVFDVANPASPVLLGSVPTGGPVTSVAASGNAAYVTTQSNTLQVIVFSTTPPDRVVTVGPTGSLASVAIPSAADFVQNQTAISQLGGFRVSGTGTVGALSAGSASVAGSASAGSASVDGLLTAGSATVSGSVGIGTASPSQKLEVAGGIKFTGTGSVLTFPDGSTQTTVGILNQTTPQAGANFNIGGNGSIGGNSTVTGNGTIGGNLGIGTTGPAARLHVAGVALINGGTAPPSASSGTGLGWNVLAANRGESEFYNYRGANSGGFRFFSTPGTAAPVGSDQIAQINAAGTYTSLSDRRVKTNITPLAQGLRTVLALRPVSYDFHTSRRLDNGVVTFLPDDQLVRALGFVAQELLPLVPEAVERPADEKKGFYAVSYTTLVPVLTQAIQEQQQQIETLKQQNAALQARAASAEAKAATAETKATQATATLETFEARLRRLEAASSGQAQR